MENKEELIAQLSKVCSLIADRDRDTAELKAIQGEIAHLQHQNKVGVAYQKLHHTGYAESTKKAIEEELQSKKVRMRTPCIVVLAVSGTLAFSAGLVSDVFGVIMLILAVASLIMLIKVQKGESNWSADQYARYDRARKRDAENKALDDKKKAELDTELRRKNNARIEELVQKSWEIESVLADVSRELDEIRILESNDKIWETAYGLLKALMSNRANTLQEAFNVFDSEQHWARMQAEQRRTTLIQEKILQHLTESEARHQAEAELLREYQLKRDREEAEHRQRMEQLIQKQLVEQERKRKEDEEYRLRYGIPQ